MDEVLARTAACAGADLAEGVRVTDLLWDEGRVVGVRALERGHPVEFRAPLVIGADGVHSVVTRRLGLSVRRPGMERIALVAHVAGIAGLGTHGEMHVGTSGYCGIAPLGDGVANVAMVLRDAGAGVHSAVEPSFWGFLRTLPALAGRLDSTTLTRPILATSNLSVRPRRLSADGVLLVGDAGGFYDPFTGQGVHRALVSASLAARVGVQALAAGDFSGRRLSLYDQQRRRRFRANHAVEWLIQQFIWRPALFDRAVARLATEQTMADALVGVTGDIVPPARVLNPWFLGRLLL
jgi:flavin-dependent dehydrogenase